MGAARVSASWLDPGNDGDRRAYGPEKRPSSAAHASSTTAASLITWRVDIRDVRFRAARDRYVHQDIPSLLLARHQAVEPLLWTDATVAEAAREWGRRVVRTAPGLCPLAGRARRPISVGERQPFVRAGRLLRPGLLCRRSHERRDSGIEAEIHARWRLFAAGTIAIAHRLSTSARLDPLASSRTVAAAGHASRAAGSPLLYDG